jgi:hypothetical protein
MKRLLALLLVLMLMPAVSRGQNLGDLMKWADDPSQVYNGVAAGMGTTIIDGEPYLLFHVAPQFKVKNFGFGFDGNFRFGEGFKLRKKDWDETYDYLRWINFISYNEPYDSLYARIGGLHHQSIGNGTIVSGYSNNSSYDDRRIGLATALRVGPLGFEGLTSDIARRGLIVGRPFIHPFQFIPVLHKLDVLSEIQIGVTGSFDFDTNALRVIPNRPPFVERIRIDSTRDSIVIVRPERVIGAPLKIYGVDLTLPIYVAQNTDFRAYGDYVKIGGFNDGFIFGAHAMWKISESLFDLRLERSLFKNGFLPNYYNTFYERDRFDDQADTADYITKLTVLDDSISGNGNGFRFGGFVSLDQLFQASLTYSHLDNVEGLDWLDLYVNLPEMWYGFTGSISFARKNIRGVADVFGIDDRSLLQMRFTLPLFKYFYGSVITRHTFDRNEQGRLTTQTMVEPKIDFVFRL